jgi:charged multivesicular body protein 6
VPLLCSPIPARVTFTNRPNSVSRAILDLKIQRDKLHQYQRRIGLLTDRETDAARQLLARGDKARALLALRRKKYQESLLAKTDAQLEQLEKLTANVEFALIQKDVVFGLQQGTRVLREIHQEMGGIEQVEKLMGETADAIAYQRVCYVTHGDTLFFSALTTFLRGPPLLLC